MNDAGKNRNLFPCFSKRSTPIGIFMVIQNYILHIRMEGKSLYIFFTQGTVNSYLRSLRNICNILM